MHIAENYIKNKISYYFDVSKFIISHELLIINDLLLMI